MGSVGNTPSANIVTRPGTISYAEGMSFNKAGFSQKELESMKKSNFSFYVSQNKNSGATVLTMNEQNLEVAKLVLWYDSVEVHNRLTGAETEYKNLQSAISGITRQRKNMLRRRQNNG